MCELRDMDAMMLVIDILVACKPPSMDTYAHTEAEEQCTQKLD